MASFILKEGMIYCEGDPNYYGLDNVILTPPKPAWYYDYDAENNEWVLNEAQQAMHEARQEKETIIAEIRKTLTIDDELALLRKSILALSNNEVLPQELADLTTIIETTKINFANALAESKVIVEEVIVPPIIGDSV